MKKALSFLLAAVLLLSVITAAAFADDIVIPEYQTVEYTTDFKTTLDAIEELKAPCSEQGSIVELSYTTPAYAVNEMLGKDGKLSGRYFTKERYDAAKETYLSYVADDATLTSKWIEGDILKTDTPDRHEALKPYEAPFFNALLNYCVLDQ